MALSRAAAGRGAEDRLQLGIHAAREGRRVSPTSSVSRSCTSRTTRSTIRRSRTRIASCRWRRRASRGARFPGVRVRVDRQPRRQRAGARRASRPAVLRLHSERSRADEDPRRGRSIGPHVVAVEGNYDDVNRLCTQIADRYGWGFANINLRSYYAEGAKTMGFEIAEQLGWRYPDHIVSPVAGGTLLPRIYKGLREFREVGLVAGQPAAHSRRAADRLGAGHPRARSGRGFPGSGEAEHDCEVACDRQPGGRLPGREGRQGNRRQRCDGDRRGNPRRDSVARDAPKGSSPSRPAARRSRPRARWCSRGVIKPNESVVVCITGNGYKTAEVMRDRVDAPTQIGRSAWPTSSVSSRSRRRCPRQYERDVSRIPAI